MPVIIRSEYTQVGLGWPPLVGMFARWRCFTISQWPLVLCLATEATILFLF